MHIIYLDYHAKSITGGHRYNDAFIDYLQKMNGEDIIKTPSCAMLYSSWRKIFSPFMELKRLRLFTKDSLVFWGDTSYKHHFLLALFAKLFKQIHSSIIIHHFSFLGETGIKKYLMLIPQFLYVSLLDDIIVPSPYTLNVAQKLFPRKRIYYIPLPFKHDFSITKDFERGNLLFVGTVDERKGLSYLIDALGYILKIKPDLVFTLNIVGKIIDQTYYEGLLVKIKRLRIEDKVRFLGRVSEDKLKECYQKAEVFVFPSLLEGYGIVLVEAMSKGLPIVAFNNSAMPYSIVDGENGLLADNMDSSSFARKLLEIIGDEPYRILLQAGMKKTVNKLKTQDDFERGIKDYYYAINNIEV